MAREEEERQTQPVSLPATLTHATSDFRGILSSKLLNALSPRKHTRIPRTMETKQTSLKVDNETPEKQQLRDGEHTVLDSVGLPFGLWEVLVW